MKRYGIIGGIAGGIVIVLAVIFFSIGQPSNKSANSPVKNSIKLKKLRAELGGTASYDTCIFNRASVLIEDLRSSVVNVEQRRHSNGSC